jgi:hypothetical protein
MKFIRTSDFGELSMVRDFKAHTGIDYSMGVGTKIEAVGSGVIQKIVDYGDVNAGKTVILHLDNGKDAVYGHLSEFLVREGQRVDPGQVIALSGNTGHSTAPHLHFAVKDHGAFVDPSNYDQAIQKMGDGLAADKGILWQGVEKGRDWGSDKMSDVAIWILEKLGDALHEIGLWLIKVAPDASMTLAMICCLGAIASIPKAGKWTAGATIGAVIAEVIRRATFGA